MKYRIIKKWDDLLEKELYWPQYKKHIFWNYVTEGFHCQKMHQDIIELYINSEWTCGYAATSFEGAYYILEQINKEELSKAKTKKINELEKKSKEEVFPIVF